jgi:hypothetical protein
MSTTLKYSRAFAFVFTILFFIGCEEKLKLENKEAEDLITKVLDLPKKRSVSLENSANYTEAFDLLQQNGLLTWKWKWEGTGYWEAGSHSLDFDVNLTDSGKSFFLEKTQKAYSLMTYDVYKFKAYDIEIDDIEGISIDQKEKTATVRFATYATNITPVAEALTKGGSKKYIKEHINGQTIQEIVFKKFDTGWKQTSEGVKIIGENEIKTISRIKTQ